MPLRDIVVPAVKLKQRSVFNLTELYQMMWRWFELYGYDMQELEYRDSLEGGSKHLEIKWKATKEIDDYIQFVIITNFLILGMENIEVEQEGVKVKLNKGEVEMNFSAFLNKDKDDKWVGGYNRILRDVYDKYVSRNRVETLEGEIYEEVYKLIDEVKAFLNLHRF